MDITNRESACSVQMRGSLHPARIPVTSTATVASIFYNGSNENIYFLLGDVPVSPQQIQMNGTHFERRHALFKSVANNLLICRGVNLCC